MDERGGDREERYENLEGGNIPASSG
jgi:hypothetical protein